MHKVLKHWFIPHSKNRHRAKILHHSSLFGIILLLFVASFGFKIVSSSHPEVLGISYSISESDLFAEVNSERAKNGLPSLQLNSELEDAARRKAADMFAKNYWAHFAPDGSTSPWMFIKGAGYEYQYAGENLAKGFTDSGSVVTAWMNSPTHRENLLSDKYQDVGFAIVEGQLQGEDTVLVVQEFGATPDEIAAGPRVAIKSDQGSLQAPAAQPVAQVPQTIQSDVAGKNSEAPLAAPETRVIQKPALDTGKTAKAISIFIIAFVVLAFIMDMMIVERKKIPRAVGHNLDHIMLITIFAIFILVLESGAVL